MRADVPRCDVRVAGNGRSGTFPGDAHYWANSGVLAMTALVEKIVQKFTEAPIEATVSSFVAGVIESTAARLARFEPTAQAGEDEVA